jgi:hypothetical protein
MRSVFLLIQMSDLLAMKSEVKQLSSLLQQLQSFLKSLSAHPPSQQQPSGGSGPSGGGGTSGGMSVSGVQGKRGGPIPVGSSSGQGGIHQGQSSRHQQQQHVHHLTAAPDAFSWFVWTFTYCFVLSYFSFSYKTHLTINHVEFS